MKKNIFFTGIVAMSVLLSTNAWAQKTENPDKDKIKEKKTKEIVIRQNGDKVEKMTIVVDGDKITVNGKPLSDYHEGDVSIINRDLKRRNSQNFSWSPDSEDMKMHFFDDDMDSAKSRAFLGVTSKEATNGVTITSVVKGSAAEKAGLQKEDIITSLNGKKITSPDDLLEAVKSYKPKDDVKVDYLRSNTKKNVTVNLGETKERIRVYSFSRSEPGMNGGGYNFAMPEMPPMPRTFNYRFFNSNAPKLGIKIEDTENGNGAKILNVEEGSAAGEAGLKKDDIITEIDSEKVNGVDEIRDQLNEVSDKENFTIKAKRNNTEMNFNIEIPKKLNSADL